MTSESELLKACLSTDSGDLVAWFGKLSNAGFREATAVLAEKIIPSLDKENLWRTVITLSRHNNKAFLGTVLKGLAKSPHFNFADTRQMTEWSQHMTTIDRHKVLIALLPKAANPEEVRTLIGIIAQKTAEIGHGHAIDYLIEAATAPTYFVLLETMSAYEHDKNLLTKICRRVMRRGDGLSYNAVSIFKAYFDLPDINSVFSLHVQPYELGRISTDFNIFLKTVT